MDISLEGDWSMEFIYEDERLAMSVIQAIHTGDIPSLKQLLTQNPGLAKVKILERKPDNVDSDSRISRTLLHVVTDWPGHFPNGADTVRVLTRFGAEVNAPFVGPNIETPLHWAASSNDVQVLDALLDAGADIEALAQSSPEAHRWTMLLLSHNGMQLGAWLSAVRPLPFGMQPPLEIFTPCKNILKASNSQNVILGEQAPPLLLPMQ